MTTRTDRRTFTRAPRALAGLLAAALLVLATAGAWHAATHADGASSDDCSLCRVVGAARADLSPAIRHRIALARGSAVVTATFRAPAAVLTVSAPARAPPVCL